MTSTPQDRRARQPKLSFSYERTESDGNEQFEVTPSPSGLRFRGALSAGSTGWTLTARARRHRRTLYVYVTARSGEPDSPGGLEDHRYEVDISDVRPGRYALCVHHVFILPNTTRMPDAVKVFERNVDIG